MYIRTDTDRLQGFGIAQAAVKAIELGSGARTFGSYQLSEPKHFPEWEQAYRASQPEDRAQADLKLLLGTPIGPHQVPALARRVEAMRALIAGLDAASANRLHQRLTDYPRDALGRLFRFELHPDTVRSLIGLLDDARRTHGGKTAPVPNQPPPPPIPPRRRWPPPPITGKPPIVVPPIVSQPPPDPRRTPPKLTPTTPGIPWRPPGVSTSLPPSDPSGPSWVWGPIGLAATALGTVVSIGVRRLSNAELADIIEAAWLVFQLEGGLPLRTIFGMAGEAAAEKLMSRVLGVDAARILNLNILRPSFPVADLISPRGLASVKVRGLLGARVGAARAPSLALEYIQDLVDVAVGGPAADSKLAKAASLLFDNRSMLERRGSWPTGFNPRSVADVERYIRDKTDLFIPHDHVQLVKRTIGEVLHRRVNSGNIRLPAGTNPVAWVNSFVDRVHSMGVTSSDFDLFLETTKHIPKEQIPRLTRERDRLSRIRRRGP
jgi:hypothetical protein